MTKKIYFCVWICQKKWELLPTFWPTLPMSIRHFAICFCAFSWYKSVRRRQHLSAYPFLFVRSSDFSFRLLFGSTMLICLLLLLLSNVCVSARLPDVPHPLYKSVLIVTCRHAYPTDGHTHTHQPKPSKNCWQCKFYSTTHLHRFLSLAKNCLFNH